MKRIILVLLCRFDEHLVDILKQGLENTFSHIVETREDIHSLNYAFDSDRNQYISPRFLTRLRRIKKDSGDKILGVLDVDLYSPDFEFVFGEAEMDSGVATVSICRLRPEYCNYPANERLLEERATKEAVHELGHLYHLGHCTSSKCVMWFSTSLLDIDNKGKTFCSRCQKKLKNIQLEK